MGIPPPPSAHITTINVALLDNFLLVLENFGLADLQHVFLEVVHGHIVSQLLNFNDVKYNTHNKEFDPDTLLATLYFNASERSLSRADMRSLWELLRQDEFYLMQLLKDFIHIPQIAGTCGKFYAMEKLEPLFHLEFNLGFMSTLSDWGVRVKLALDIMDLIEELDSKTVYGLKWQHCDVQPSNFGVNHAGTVKAIDVDLMYTDEKIAEILGNGNCSSHKDCDFFDCVSLCDVKRKKCTSVRISNNLQVGTMSVTNDIKL